MPKHILSVLSGCALVGGLQMARRSMVTGEEGARRGANFETRISSARIVRPTSARFCLKKPRTALDHSDSCVFF